MRTAFVHIPRFPCAVEVVRDPGLDRLPLIIGDGDRARNVFDCSLEAQAEGVTPGMQMRRALSICPDAVVLPPDPVLYSSRWHTVLDVLDAVSPEVEDEAPGCAYLNATGLTAVGSDAALAKSDALFPDEPTLAGHILAIIRAASGLTAAVGIAEGKFPAFAAARLAGEGGTRAVPAGGEAEFLAPATVSFLPVAPEIVLRLQLLGLETVGDVATIPLPALQTQFGFEGKRLWQLANGFDEERLQPRQRLETLEASLAFETPVGGIDILVAAAKQLLSRLRLPLRGRASRELTLQAELVSGRGWEKRFVFREAVSDSQRLIFVLRSVLTNTPPPAAVKGLLLRLSGLTGETGKQLSLGERGRVQRQMEEAVRQLKARYGFSPVYRCIDVEPWSVIPEERQILVESDA
jgi:nucleotidyltransferase/DNA polymerase involved in DNA repair